MQRTSRLLLLVCGSLTPLFAGCGGCGSPSLASQQAARGDWGADDEVPEVPATPPQPAPSPVTDEAASPPAETAAAQPPATPTPPVQPPAAVTAPQDSAPVASNPPASTPPVQPPAEVQPPATAAAPAPVASVTPASNAAPPTTPVAGAPATPTLVAPPAVAEGSPIPAASNTAPTDPATTGEPQYQVASASEMQLPERPIAPGESTTTLLPQAKEFAAAGKETEADRLLLAEALLRDRLEEWPFAMRWSPALRRPVPWIRTGFGFYVTATEVRGDMAPIPAKDRALEREFGPMGRDVLALGGELAEKSLAAHLTLLRAGELGPTLSPVASGPVDAGRPLPTRLCGGLVLFGPGEPRLLKAHAERLGLDLLIVCDVRAKRNADDVAQPINDTSVKILDVVGDREIFSTKLLRNLEVQATRKNPVAPDPVDPVTKEIQQFLDTQLALTDMPLEVRPDNVRGRLPKLIDQALVSKNALPYLVEIKALHLLGYLAGLEARDAYASILGEAEGQTLYSGTPEERLVVLERLLPRLQGVAKTVDTASVND